MADEWKWYENTESGVIHRFMVLADGEKLTPEKDNVDTAQHLEEIAEEEALKLLTEDGTRACRNCLKGDKDEEA